MTDPMTHSAEKDAPQFDPDGILTCEAVAITWGRCTLLRGHGGWHRAAFDGGRRWPSTQRLYTEQEVWRVIAEHYFVVNPTAYGQESCVCGWYRDGWDAPSFEAHLASRLGLLATPAEANQGQRDCHHEWLDRPESDSRECLICGEAVFGG